MGMSVFFAWWGLSLLSFVLGDCVGGPLYWLAPSLLSALAWLLAWRKSASACLAASVLVAAIGILLKAPAAPMIVGAAASLGLWDFATAENAGYVRSRLPYTLLAVGAGTIVAVLGSFARIALPFGVVALCVIACALGLDQATRRLRGSGNHRAL
jgi:hypothetical protein